MVMMNGRLAGSTPTSAVSCFVPGWLCKGFGHFVVQANSAHKSILLPLRDYAIAAIYCY